MNCFKSDIFSSYTAVSHGFVTFQNPINTESLSEKEGLKTIKTIKQIHSNNFVHLTNINKFEKDYEADSIVTDVKGYGVGIYTADCVPLIFMDRMKNIYGVIHAGWKGTLAGITSRVFKYLINELNCDNNHIDVAIGPCIEGSCYEIGEEIARQFQMTFENTEFYLTGNGENKFKLDLRMANIDQLKNEGISNIETIDICTKCDLNFPSYRRDGKDAGRMLSFIGLV